MLQLVERRTAGKPRLLRLLDDEEAAGWCRQTEYVTADSLASRAEGGPSPSAAESQVAEVLRQAGESETGLAVFAGDLRAMAVAPPFPIEASSRSEGFETAPLRQLLQREYTIGVVLLRLGRYAVAVMRGDQLVATKTASRYMKGRHRAGGQSQRRFERSRERLIRELYDKACEVSRDVLSPFEGDLDYLLMGGETHTLRGFVERCRYIRDMGPITLKRHLQVDQPNREALERMPFEVWRSQVFRFDQARDGNQNGT